MYYLQSILSIPEKTVTKNMAEKSTQTRKFFLDMTCNRKEYFLFTCVIQYIQ